MESSSALQSEKTIAALIHLSTFTQLVFPFGNFLFPLILWTAKRKHPFVDAHGKQALNFQISLYLYFVFLILIGVAGVLIIGVSLAPEEAFQFNEEFIFRDPSRFGPLVILLITVLLLIITLLVLGIYGVVMATIRAGEGAYYQYPLCINFLRTVQPKAEDLPPVKDPDQKNETL